MDVVENIRIGVLKDIKQMEDGLSVTIKHDGPDVLSSSDNS